MVNATDFVREYAPYIEKLLRYEDYDDWDYQKEGFHVSRTGSVFDVTGRFYGKNLEEAHIKFYGTRRIYIPTRIEVVDTVRPGEGKFVKNMKGVLFMGKEYRIEQAEV